MRALTALLAPLILCTTSALDTVTAGALLKQAVVEDVPCSSRFDSAATGVGCLTTTCRRKVVDGIFSGDDIDALLEIAKKGLDKREGVRGGPSIVDINTGYIRDSNGLVNMFASDESVYTSEDFRVYGSIIKRLKEEVESTFENVVTYFTAPTFITRLDGNSSWEPQEPHDEYWHAHSDMANTAHYFYSGLLYLSDFEVDFTGGRFLFLSHNSSSGDDVYVPDDDYTVDSVVEPRRGRVVVFTAGEENMHRVERVTSGERFVLSFWFTCDQRKEFQIFLDGKMHLAFANKVKDQMRRQQREGL